MEVQQPMCPQCNTYHPALAPGQNCPMIPVKSATGQRIDYTRIFDPLKTILLSQVETKDIKDMDSFYAYMIVEITKAAEAYKEG